MAGNGNKSSSEPQRCFKCNSTSHMIKDCNKKINDFDRTKSSSWTTVQGVIAWNTKPTCKGRMKVKDGKFQELELSDDEDVSCYVSELKKCCQGHRGRVALKCGHKVSVLNLAYNKWKHSGKETSNMPTCNGLAKGKQVTVLRDTGCNSGVIRTKLVDTSCLTGEKQSCLLIDGTLRKYPTAIIHVDTPYFIGTLKVLCMDNPLYDLIIGNVPDSREPHDPNSNWTSTMNTFPEGSECSSVSNVEAEQVSPHSVILDRPGQMDISIPENERVSTDNVNQDAIPHVQAVETRTIKRKRDAPVQPLKVPGPISEISPREFKECQREDPSIEHLWSKAKGDDTKKVCLFLK